jgi:hypothetical protein
MIATDLLENYSHYNRFALWTASSLEEFMESHELMHEVFINEYGMLFSSRNEIPFSDFEIMEKMLSYFNDKHFVVFCYSDRSHQKLIKLQEQKSIIFSFDISDLKSGVFYILEMNKISG